MDGKVKHVCSDGSEVILDAHPKIKNHSVLALRQWTTMDTGAQNRGDSTVLLHVTHSNLARHFHELRLDMHMTVDALKDKLRAHVGTGSAHMWLTLLDDSDQMIADLDDDTRMLGYYSPYDGCTIHVRACCGAHPAPSEGCASQLMAWRSGAWRAHVSHPG